MKLWIARDKDGCLVFFDKKPYKVDDHYENDGNWLTIIQGDLLYNDFPTVTFENSPQQVELKLCNTDFDRILEENKDVLKRID